MHVIGYIWKLELVFYPLVGSLRSTCPKEMVTHAILELRQSPRPFGLSKP
jgi:hypothetical protein